MARPREKGSKLSYGSYNLKPEEDKDLIARLEADGLTAKSLVRVLLRMYIKHGVPEIAKQYSKK